MIDRSAGIAAISGGSTPTSPGLALKSSETKLVRLASELGTVPATLELASEMLVTRPLAEQATPAHVQTERPTIPLAHWFGVVPAQ